LTGCPVRRRWSTGDSHAILAPVPFRSAPDSESLETENTKSTAPHQGVRGRRPTNFCAPSPQAGYGATIPTSRVRLIAENGCRPGWSFVQRCSFCRRPLRTAL